MDRAEERVALAASLHRLSAGFPDVPHDVVSTILGDSYVTVVTVTGQPEVERAEQLATLRLEVRTGHPVRAEQAPATAL